MLRPPYRVLSALRLPASLLAASALLSACGGEDAPAPAPSGDEASSAGGGQAPQQSPENADREPASAPADAPNVVVILIDTTRPDHLPPYGYDRKVAPFLHRLSERSVVFTRAHSTSSWTGPSTASLFTGLYPTRHGLTRGFFAQRDEQEAVETEGEARLEMRPLPEEVATLPQLMKDLGYSTFGYAANINIGPELGFDRGFDLFERERKRAAPEILADLRRWKDRMERESPSFLYLHFNDPHKPYNPREPLYSAREDELEDLIARYDSEIRYVDITLRKLYEEFGWDEDTILWILSDHGEEFRERGEIGHGFSLYNELMRVVMMLHAPGVEPGRVDLNVSLVDVLPTLMEQLDVLGLEGRDGRSLLPLLLGERDGAAEERFGERVLFGHRLKRREGEEKWAALLGRYKLIHDATTGEWWLFDLEEDPGETTDRSAEHPEIVTLLKDSLKRLQEQRSLEGGSVEVPLNSDTLEHLRTLGYFEGEEEGG